MKKQENFSNVIDEKIREASSAKRELIASLSLERMDEGLNPQKSIPLKMSPQEAISKIRELALANGIDIINEQDTSGAHIFTVSVPFE